MFQQYLVVSIFFWRYLAENNIGPWKNDQVWSCHFYITIIPAFIVHQLNSHYISCQNKKYNFTLSIFSFDILLLVTFSFRRLFFQSLLSLYTVSFSGWSFSTFNTKWKHLPMTLPYLYNILHEKKSEFKWSNLFSFINSCNQLIINTR